MMFALRMAADDNAPGHVRRELTRWLAEHQWPIDEGRDLVMAVSEAVSNSVEHAYAARRRADDEPNPVVTVDIEQVSGAAGRRIQAVVEDFGAWRAAPQAKGYRGRGLARMEFLTASCVVDHRGSSGTKITMLSTLTDWSPQSATNVADVDATLASDAFRLGHTDIVLPVSADSGEHQGSAEERVRWLEAVTDVGLAHMSVDRLLDELLEKVRELMSVDTAAVLLLDPSRQFLIATVAKGIEEEVHQGVRIPLGRGFAGRIAEDRRWVALERVDHDNVLNPILREKGISSMLGVPLVAGGAVIGVLHVGTLHGRPFGPEDAELLQIVADRAAMAIQSRMSQAERAAASIMQRHLLPARLPEISGLECASRYVAGGQGAVGGDWYDVFLLRSGAVCLVVGDVVGHGLKAAQSMSRLSAVLRALALDTEDPAELLARLDEHVHHFGLDTMATVLCGMHDPASDRLLISSAGHPPPILAGPEGEATVVPIHSDLLLGAALGHPRHTIEVTLSPGSVLCLYSDGLVERRGLDIDDNIEVLRRTVRARAAENVCVAVMQKLIGFATPEDDVALLVARRLTVS
jgi:anti-sigma regulatory factor (Ser/Thr protein kinase)